MSAAALWHFLFVTNGGEWRMTNNTKMVLILTMALAMSITTSVFAYFSS